MVATFSKNEVLYNVCFFLDFHQLIFTSATLQPASSLFSFYYELFQGIHQNVKIPSIFIFMNAVIPFGVTVC